MITNTRPHTYISVYMPIAGWKAIMYKVDKDCGNRHTPWTTSDNAFNTKAEAVSEAKSWAEEEGLLFYDDCPEQTNDAPDKSVLEQLTDIFPNAQVIKL